MKILANRYRLIILVNLALLSCFVGPLWSVVVKNPANLHYYELVASTKDWVEARTLALSSTHNYYPGYLATITSQNENDFALSVFPTAGVSDGCYIGGACFNDTEQLFIWADGPEAGQHISVGKYPNASCLSYCYWAPSAEPSFDLDGTGPLAIDYFGFPAIEWNDLRSSYTRPYYLVEYSPIPVYFPITDHYYEVVGQNMTWDDAKNYASLQSLTSCPGYLATVTSDAENDFIVELLDGATAYIGGISIYDTTPSFVWGNGPEFGQPISNGTNCLQGFCNWGNGQPPPGGAIPPILVIAYNDTKWVSTSKNGVRAFVIEYDCGPPQNAPTSPSSSLTPSASFSTSETVSTSVSSSLTPEISSSQTATVSTSISSSLTSEISSSQTASASSSLTPEISSSQTSSVSASTSSSLTSTTPFSTPSSNLSAGSPFTTASSPLSLTASTTVSTDITYTPSVSSTPIQGISSSSNPQISRPLSSKKTKTPTRKQSHPTKTPTLAAPKTPRFSTDCADPRCKVDTREIEFDEQNKGSKQTIPITTKKGKFEIGSIIIPPYTFQPGCILRLEASNADASSVSKDECDTAMLDNEGSSRLNITLLNCPDTDISHLNNSITIQLVSNTKESEIGCLAFVEDGDNTWICQNTDIARYNSRYSIYKASFDHLTSFAVIFSSSSFDACSRLTYVYICSGLIGGALLTWLVMVILFYTSETFRAALEGHHALSMSQLAKRIYSTQL